MRNGRLRQAQRLDQVADADRLAARRQQVDDPHPGRIGQRFEDIRRRRRLEVGEHRRRQWATTRNRLHHRSAHPGPLESMTVNISTIVDLSKRNPPGYRGPRGREPRAGVGGADPERLGDLRGGRVPGHRGGAAVHERVGGHHGASLPRGGRAWAWAGAISIGNVVLTLAGIAEGTRLAGAAVASVLLNSAPFFVALGARVWLSEHLTRRQVLGLVVGFGGILVIVVSQGGSSGSSV